MMIKKLLSPEYIKTFRRMVIIGIVTLVIGVICNQFIQQGIRLPILINSIPFYIHKKTERISPEDAVALFNKKNAVFVDIRSEDEFDMDHISGALSLPVISFISNPGLLKRYDKGNEMTAVLYSGKEKDDTIDLLARFLIKKGVQQVKILDGGFGQWSKNNYPVEY